MTGLGSSCGACKFLRRKCTNECVFAPYFCYDEAANHFAAVHKVFGASNVSKLLLHLPIHNRHDAAVTISYEALARIQDPIYGCVAHIFSLQQQVASLQEEIEVHINQMANHAAEVPSYGNFQAENMNTLCFQDEQATLANPLGFVSSFYEFPLEINIEGFEFESILDDPCMWNTGVPSNWEVLNWE